MNYKNYVEIVKLEDTTDEPSESSNRVFTVIPSYYRTVSPSTIYMTRQHNNDYTETLLIIIFSSLATTLFILFVLWYKYNRKNTKKNPIKKLDYDFGTRIILNDI
jgi:hypothetical protein